MAVYEEQEIHNMSCLIVKLVLNNLHATEQEIYKNQYLSALELFIHFMQHNCKMHTWKGDLCAGLSVLIVSTPDHRKGEATCLFTESHK